MNLRNATDRISEIVISTVALVAIAIIFLIFIYVGREALPLLTGNAEGITLASPFTAPYVWQPVSNVPKYNVFPSHDRAGVLSVAAVFTPDASCGVDQGAASESRVENQMSANPPLGRAELKKISRPSCLT